MAPRDMTKLRLIRARSWRDRGLFLEAFARLVVAKLLVECVAFRRFAHRLGEAQTETPRAIAPAQRAIAVDVSWAVQAVARHIRAGFVCLPQAMAAQAMLRRRGVATTLYLGVAPDRADRATITAHAWLRAGDKIVTGETEAARHKALASFADPRP